MRIESVSALVLSAFALAACEGVPSSGSTTSAATLALCGLPCPDGTPGGGFVDADGDGIDDNVDGNDSSTDGGNTTNLSAATSDTTIALESSRYVSPASGTSLSLLTAGTSPATTTAQILSGTKPTKLTIQIDTNSASNGNWPTPVQMTEYPTGTGAPDPTGGNNGGAGGNYREYRVYSEVVGQERDESLQVWAWGNSYATQYRNTPSGGEATHQAWSFGGNRTALASMPVAASTNYTGRFVGTAKTSNWVKPGGALIDPNALWRIQGASAVTADWGAATVTGTLTPGTWTSYQDGINATYMKTVGTTPTPPYSAVETPNYSFYDTTIALNGTITGNTYAGTATLSGSFISGDQVMYGGFFGAGAPTETTGVFHVNGTDPYPIGGEGGINDDKRGKVVISGAFNAN